MATSAPVLCKSCGKDISNAKRIKSPQGHFYCQACCAAAAARKTAAQPSRAGVAAPPPQVPQRPPARPAARPVAQPAPAKKSPGEISFTRCPNCDAPVIPGRRICVKCKRDMTQMDDIIARRAERSKASMEDRFGAVFGIALKGAGVLLVLGIIGLAGYMVYEWTHPGTVFDDYPTKREAAVRQILGDIAQGTDQGYAKAFQTVTMRYRDFSNNPNEAGRYKMVYTRMHQDFASKYGPDWPSKAKIECEDPGSTEQDVTYLVTLNEDTYHVVTEGQQLMTNAVQFVESNTKTFPEDGKNHFGIADIEEYSLLPKSKDRQAAGEQLLKQILNPKDRPR